MNRITHTGFALLLLPTLMFGPGCAGSEPDPKDAHELGSREHDPQVVQVTPGEMEEFGIQIDEAGPGELRLEAVLPGVVEVNPDGLVHITPRVPGVVRDVF